jgi:hypothetical protein
VKADLAGIVVVLQGGRRRECVDDSLFFPFHLLSQGSNLLFLRGTQNIRLALKRLSSALFAGPSLAIQAFSSILFLSGALQAPIFRYRSVELPYVGVLSSREACPRHGAVGSVQKQVYVLDHLA